MAQLDEPIDDEGEQITERIDTVTWSGGRIRPGEFQEFGVSFQVPEDAEPGTALKFPAVQTYTNPDEVRRWIEAEDGESPAPTVTVLEAPPEGEEAAATPAATPAADAGGGAVAQEEESGGSDTLSIIALIVGAIGLITGLVALTRRGGGRGRARDRPPEKKDEVGGRRGTTLWRTHARRGNRRESSSRPAARGTGARPSLAPAAPSVQVRSAQAIFGPPAVVPPGGMKWITIDCASGRATQSADPRPCATPSSLAAIPAIGSSVDESHNSFGGIGAARGSSW